MSAFAQRGASAAEDVGDGWAGGGSLGEVPYGGGEVPGFAIEGGVFYGGLGAEGCQDGGDGFGVSEGVEEAVDAGEYNIELLFLLGEKFRKWFGGERRESWEFFRAILNEGGMMSACLSVLLSFFELE